MKIRDRVSAAVQAFRGGQAVSTDRAYMQALDVRDLNDPAIADFLRAGSLTNSGASVTARSGLASAVAWRCASIITGTIGSLPRDLMLRASEGSRQAAVDHPFRAVLTERPNNRQTPSEFLQMLQLHKLQVGDGFAMKIVSRGRILALWPLDPARMEVIEAPAPSTELVYRYTRLNGTRVDFTAGEILHLRGPSWDGVRGLPVIKFMAEAIGLGMQTQRAAANLFRNGQFTPGYLKTEKQLSDKAYERLKESRDRKSGVDAEDAGKIEILEEGLSYQESSLSAVDAQLIEIWGFSRDDVGMFYGVPPFLYGDTTKATSWGSGIEQQNIGFLQYTIEPHLTAWSETIRRDCLAGDDPRLYVHFDLKGFLRADAAGRSAYLARALGGGGSAPWMTQNEARAAEDLPRSTAPHADELPKIGSGKDPAAPDPNAPNNPNADPAKKGQQP